MQGVTGVQGATGVAGATGVGAQGATGIAGLGGTAITVSVNTLVTTADYVVLVDATAGAITITFPTAASSSGKGWVIKKIAGANSVILDADGVELIDFAQTYTLIDIGESLTVHSDGTQLWIL